MTDTQILTLAVIVVFPVCVLLYSIRRQNKIMRDEMRRGFQNVQLVLADLRKQMIEGFDRAELLQGTQRKPPKPGE